MRHARTFIVSGIHAILDCFRCQCVKRDVVSYLPSISSCIGKYKTAEQYIKTIQEMNVCK